MENESITYNFPFELSIIEYQVEIYEASWDMIKLMIICKKGSEILRYFYYQSFRSEQYIYHEYSLKTGILKGVFNIITGILNDKIDNQTPKRLNDQMRKENLNPTWHCSIKCHSCAA